jgi:hypothetical protein
MSLHDAMRFITAVRASPKLLQETSALNECRLIGKRMGLDFSLEDLLDAHGKDWALRWFHFRKVGLAPTDSGSRGR